MKIGLTYDLRSEYLSMGYSEEETAEFDKESTIEGIENALHEIGYETERIGHVKSLMKLLLQGKKWDIVFNICEGMYGQGRESIVPSLLDVYQIPYVFSGPTVLALSLDKAFCKRIVRDGGIPTPDFCVVKNNRDTQKSKPDFPLFLKPLSEGTGKGISEHSLVNSEIEYREVCCDLLDRFHQPVLVESYLPGREYTVGVVGNCTNSLVAGVMEVTFKKNVKKIYSYENKENYKEVIEYNQPEPEIYQKCSDLALKVWNILGVNDGGRVDMKLNKQGEPEFIEINPLAGLNYLDSDLPILSGLNNISFTQLISMIMRAAEKRIFGQILSSGLLSE
ncbi:MAG: ATP-grasp domain-containing protein [Prolixibacteraceae bacterium]|nr:ATP-grasp domain-containing protein [Prolixibacteraceae bacterium]